jgi:four helix bundle protein
MKKKILTLKDLEIYQLANLIGNEIWSIVSNWKYFEKDTIGKQLCRSVDSISANIAEGFGRFYFKENKLFCYYSRGSLMESMNWIEKSFNRNLISEEKFIEINDQLENLLLKLNAYIKSIGKVS